MKLTLGFSPCPNDTFIFDAMMHGKIDTEGLSFDVRFEDVETLNQLAFRGELDLTKLSYHAYAYAVDQYVLFDAGSALGFGVGPLLITKNPAYLNLKAALADTTSDAVQTDTKSILPGIQKSVDEIVVGIPGKYTTANFLLNLAFPQLQNKRLMVFSDIEQALLNGEIDLGLIIHENRFTYSNKGLHKIVDLGDFWEQSTGHPIPLGGIVGKRSLPQDILLKVNRIIRRSVEYAFAHPEDALPFIRSHAQEMDDSVLFKHIELYVNEFSVDLGSKGRGAIDQLFQRARQLNLIPVSNASSLFL